MTADRPELIVRRNSDCIRTTITSEDRAVVGAAVGISQVVRRSRMWWWWMMPGVGVGIAVALAVGVGVTVAVSVGVGMGAGLGERIPS